MAQPTDHKPALLMLAAISRHDEALDWARQQASRAWGPVALTSPSFSFDDTDYYESAMGTELKKVFFAFERLVDPAEMAQIKHQTNGWEATCSGDGRWPERRPLNLDPGYLTEAKLVLASTKDRDHRIYLSGGIYAEVTLYFRGGAWRNREWTYPDYRRDEYHQFFTRCREYLRSRQREGRA